MVAFGIGLMAPYARIVSDQVLSIRENDYVLAARGVGASSFRIMFHHILPNSLQSMIVMMTLMIGHTFLFEAGLSFLGIGITEPTVVSIYYKNNLYCRYD